MTNYLKDKQFMKSNWLCKCGDEQEEESHPMSGNCEVYGDMRNNYPDLENDDELLKLFSKVLERRDILMKEDE